MRNLLGSAYFAKGIRPYARAPYGLFTEQFIKMCLSKNLKLYGWRDNPFTVEKGDIILIHVNQKGLDYIKNISSYTNGLLQPVTIDYLEDEENRIDSTYEIGENRNQIWTLDSPPLL